MTIRLALTPGEPAGIGVDLCVQLAQSGSIHELVAFADPELLESRAKLLGLPLKLRHCNDKPRPLSPGELAISPISLSSMVEPGKLNPANAQYVLSCLTAAKDACLDNSDMNCRALITGPVHKGIINEAGIAFSGHTEFFAEQTGTARVVMMLATEGLRVALATTHLPLTQVPAAITPELLYEVIGILHRDMLDKFGIDDPRILVCGLNPHAGEAGHMGREEIEVIEPVLEQLRSRGLTLIGPLPADTLFTPKYLDHCDAVLAMYHDQGLPVLKYKGFGAAVNITLGLPFIRTSVDHGTALDLAGSGQANTGSLETAIRYAADLANGSDS